MALGIITQFRASICSIVYPFTFHITISTVIVNCKLFLNILNNSNHYWICAVYSLCYFLPWHPPVISSNFNPLTLCKYEIYFSATSIWHCNIKYNILILLSTWMVLTDKDQLTQTNPQSNDSNCLPLEYVGSSPMLLVLCPGFFCAQFCLNPFSKRLVGKKINNVTHFTRSCGF